MAWAPGRSHLLRTQKPMSWSDDMTSRSEMVDRIRFHLYNGGIIGGRHHVLEEPVSQARRISSLGVKWPCMVPLHQISA